MRLFFIGSIHDKDHPPETGVQPRLEHEPLFLAARELGQAAASRGHTVLVGSDSKNTMDYYLESGVEDFCNSHPDRQVSLEIHRPNDKKMPYPQVPANLKVTRRFYHQDESSPHKWIVTHVRMLDSCDAVVTLGGDTSTRLVGNIAADRQMPVLAIASFGGASTEIYDRLQYVYPRIANVEALESLIIPWQSSFADKVIALVESLAEKSADRLPHLYFISYSWGDREVADHVEALLRRNNRNVLRDEENIKSGDALSGAIEALIDQSDTFVALWSKNYESSSWCPNELDYARNCQHEGKKPKRIILLRLDDTKVPIRFTGTLHRAGASREKRLASLLTMLREENAPPVSSQPA